MENSRMQLKKYLNLLIPTFILFLSYILWQNQKWLSLGLILYSLIFTINIFYKMELALEIIELTLLFAFAVYSITQDKWIVASIFFILFIWLSILLLMKFEVTND